MKTIKEFSEKSHIPASLIRAVIRQFGGWQSFRESAQDITNHGADGGFGGFIYYADTVKFARNNRSHILSMARDMASDIGDGDEYQLIAGFNCLRCDNLTPGAVARAIHTGKGDDATSVLNALAWFALEEVARSYCDLCDAE